MPGTSQPELRQIYRLRDHHPVSVSNLAIFPTGESLPVSLREKKYRSGFISDGTGVTFIATSRAVERRHGDVYLKGHGIILTKAGEKAEVRGSGIIFPAGEDGRRPQCTKGPCKLL